MLIQLIQVFLMFRDFRSQGLQSGDTVSMLFILPSF